MSSSLAPTRPLPEVELLRIKVAHLEWQVAQLQAHIQLTQLSQHREALITQALRAQVPEDEVESYVIDLDSGRIHPHDALQKEDA